MAILTQGIAVTPYEEFWRYFVVSGVALVVDYGLLIGLTEVFSIHYLISGAAGFLAGADRAHGRTR